MFIHVYAPLHTDYANFGSDIGGYRSGSGKLGRTKELLIRWAQLGAFSPLMENGGDKEHRPWEFDSTNQTLDIYRKYAFSYIHCTYCMYMYYSICKFTGVIIIQSCIYILQHLYMPWVCCVALPCLFV